MSLLESWSWGEFKKFMEENGVEDYHTIWYIDIDRDSENEISLMVDEDGIQMTNYPNF